ncbi:MAG: hypothetical protein ACOC10_07775 [Bacteroidota bacterium]
MNKYIFIIFYALNVFGFSSTVSQITFTEVADYGVYSDELGIVNGKKWQYSGKYKGHPFWKDDDIFQGEVTFNGRNFQNLNLKLDLFHQELILFKKINDETIAIKLNRNFIEDFILEESGNAVKSRFLCMKLPGIEGINFYQLIYDGNTKCFIHHKKSVNNEVTGNYLGKYLYQPVIYINTGNQYSVCKNKKSFLRLFGGQRKILRAYMRKNKLGINARYPEEIAQVLAFYDSLNQ